MNSALYKRARGVEFCNLLEQLKAKRIKEADVARKLGKTQSAISQYKSGGTTPTVGTLEVMRIWTAEVMGAERVPAPETESPLQLKLQELERNDPEGYEVARATVDVLHKRMKRQAAPANSDVPSEVKPVVERVAGKLSREDQKS